MNQLAVSDDARVTDPVCGMLVDPARTSHRAEFAGTTYFFCSARCAERFNRDPQSALAEAAAPASTGLASCRSGHAPHAPPPSAQQPMRPSGSNYVCPMCPGVDSDVPAPCPKCGMALEPATPAPKQLKYTCPMHPEVVQDGPGTCPKCGMALEPVSMSADEANPELVDMTRRFWVGLAFTVPLLVLAMAHYAPGLAGAIERLVPPYVNNGLQLVLAAPVVLWAGWPFFERGWRSIATRH